MAIQRSSTSAAASDTFDGMHAYRDGQQYSSGKSAEWQTGWIAAAEDAQRQLAASSALISRRAEIVDTLILNFAVMKTASGHKLNVRQRERLNQALIATNTLIARLGELATLPSQLTPAAHEGRAAG